MSPRARAYVWRTVVELEGAPWAAGCVNFIPVED